MKFKIAFSIFMILVIAIMIMPKTPKVILTNAQNQEIKVNVELAKTRQEQIQGLMYREHLPEDGGMLFVYNNERKWSFWMKNTLIPLDLIYINSDFEVVDIKHNFEPCKTILCPSHTPLSEAQYILEVNADFAKQNNINIGDKVYFHNI
jgi:uncharacterized membrane protein (UPF0127 family)